MRNIMLPIALVAGFLLTASSCGEGNKAGSPAEVASAKVDSVKRADSLKIAELTKTAAENDSLLNAVKDASQEIAGKALKTFSDNHRELRDYEGDGITSQMGQMQASSTQESEKACRPLLKLMTEKQRADYNRMTKEMKAIIQ